jgi:hypothetical protein
VTGGTALNEDQVDQVQSGFQLDSNDTIAITPPVETYDCDGIRSVLGGALRGSVQNVDDAESHDYDHPVSLVKDKVSRYLGAVDGKTPGYVADAVGQVPLDEDDVPLPNLSDELSRMPTACDSDSNESDRFSHGGSWSTTATRSLGQPNTHCGETTKNGMLISELANGDGQQDAIEIFNATNSTIDLDDEGYMLEIYRDGSEQPDQVINLDGQIGPSGVFVIANSDNDDTVTDIAGQLSDEVDLNNASAVLLVRRFASAARLCSQSLNWTIDLPLMTEIFYAPPPIDSDPPPRVDPPASPN